MSFSNPSLRIPRTHVTVVIDKVLNRVQAFSRNSHSENVCRGFVELSRIIQRSFRSLTRGTLKRDYFNNAKDLGVSLITIDVTISI